MNIQPQVADVNVHVCILMALIYCEIFGHTQNSIDRESKRSLEVMKLLVSPKTCNFLSS
jgi:hypothetical protein